MKMWKYDFPLKLHIQIYLKKQQDTFVKVFGNGYQIDIGMPT